MTTNPLDENMKTLHLLSGGLDSTVLLYDLLQNRADVRCVGFEYGQTHHRELDAARAITKALGLSYETVELARVFGGSSLLGESGSIVVPNRNMVFLSVAAAMAEADGREFVTYGCTAEDFDGFPDCRPAFVAAMNAALRAAGLKVSIRTPYVEMSKRDVASIGRKLGVPMEATWSCYLGGDEPCGVCDACKKREAALQ